jgi:AcrR family transcriptional regulator
MATDQRELTGAARKGQQRREAIIDAAIEVFAERGYRDGSLQEVGDRVGISPAAVLYHFGTKEALLLAVIAERDRRAASSPLPGGSDTKGLEALRASVRFAEQSERERGLAALHTVLEVESLEDGALTHDYFVGRSRFLRAAVADLLREGQQLGEVRADLDVEAKALEVVAFLEGAAVVWLVDPEQVSLVDLYRRYFDDLSAAVAAEGG